ncbi:MAG: hypothetical protein QM640_10335 [Niabella sp.]
MRSLLLITACIAFSYPALAQGMGGMGGGMRGGMRPEGGAEPFQQRQFRKNADANFFMIELKDSTKITGPGSVKVKNGLSTLEIKQDGKERSFTPDQVAHLSHPTRNGIEEYINFENKYWLGKLSMNVEQFYQTAGETDLVFIKDKTAFREATKEDIINLVKENKEAYKYAKRGNIKKSLNAYIGNDAPPAQVKQASDDEEADNKKNRPLFNAQ